MDLNHESCYRAVQTRDARFDGKFFTAVKTTGIYCRPICPARTPYRTSVIFFQSAAGAQEAGFRPCLRCRPEISPYINAWHGTSNTVSRALTLIEGGALDSDSVDALADRLGIGERQLRRLFQKHIGASPISVAQTRRILLAKQLLHETDLSMANIAMAAGFGSIRRFNEIFQQLYGESPTILRRAVNNNAGGGAFESITIKLYYKEPYDWNAILDFLSHRAIPGVEHVTNSKYARTIQFDDSTGTIEIEKGNGPYLLNTIRIAKLNALPFIISRIRRLFDLGADPAAIGAHLSEDPILAPLVKARPGIRVPGAWDGFELAIRAILGQQITVTAATKLAGKLVNEYGKPFENNSSGINELTRIFPSPEVLAHADLATLGMPKTRAKTLSTMAAHIADNPMLFSSHQNLDDAIETLCNLSGIGEWTANYIAMRELREPDAFPAADVGLLKAMADKDGKRPTPKELLKRSEAWRPWRAYATFYLWDSLKGGE